jgi:hypothetical protein
LAYINPASDPRNDPQAGLPADAEPRMQRWYDSFEAALANFTGDGNTHRRAT